MDFLARIGSALGLIPQQTPYDKVFGTEIGSVSPLTRLMIETVRSSYDREELKELVGRVGVLTTDPLDKAVAKIILGAHLSKNESITTEMLNERLGSLAGAPYEIAAPQVKAIIALSNACGLRYDDLEINRLSPELRDMISREIIDPFVVARILDRPAAYDVVLNSLSASQKTETLYFWLMQRGITPLNTVPRDKRTEAVCRAAVKNAAWNFEFVPEEIISEELCAIQVRRSGEALSILPESKKTKEICAIAVKQDWRAIRHVPKDQLTDELVLEALKGSPFAVFEISKQNMKLEWVFWGVINDAETIKKVPGKFLIDVILKTIFYYDVLKFGKRDNFSRILAELNELVTTNPVILSAIPHKYRRAGYSVSEIPSEVRQEIQEVSANVPNGASLERLGYKLLDYAGGDEGTKASLFKALEKVALEKPFVGTPKATERNLLKCWYAQIKLLLVQLDSVIDEDPLKDGESKSQLIELFSVCGGGWQSQLEQMHSKLVVFHGLSAKGMVGCVFKGFADTIIDGIHLAYSQELGRALNVHDRNRIRTILKKYLPVDVLEDHLSRISWTSENVREKFFLQYTPESLLRELSEAYRKDGSALQAELSSYYQDEMFRGCKSLPDFDREIARERTELESKIALHTEKTRRCQEILELFPGERDAIVSFFKAKGAAHLRLASMDPGILGELKALKTYAVLVSQMADFSQTEVFSKSHEEILVAFDAAHQKKVENLAVENFEKEHVGEDGFIKETGLYLILQAMGFLTKTVIIGPD